MSDFFRDHAGRWFVVAALLPLLAALVLLAAGTARNLARMARPRTGGRAGAGQSCDDWPVCRGLAAIQLFTFVA